MSFSKAIHTLWFILVGLLFYGVLIILLQSICILFKGLRKQGILINKICANFILRCTFYPIRKEWRFAFDPSKKYILCSNHFSYFDILTMCEFPHPIIFIGKKELGNIPIFGMYYKKLNITVDRRDPKSRKKSLFLTRKAIENNETVCIFPEGGIRLKNNIPQMASFQSGAFKLSTDYNIPIVPVTLPDNYRILPTNKFILQKKSFRIIFHPPMLAKDKTRQGIDLFSKEVYDVIQTELNNQLNVTK